ncbi:hypothetical protein D1007_06342 [Hordeum vulgare]|nr:hypothetical protein D1007_06342 [Hordeum vulgare]
MDQKLKSSKEELDLRNKRFDEAQAKCHRGGGQPQGRVEDTCVNRMDESTGWLPPSHGRVKLNTDGSVLNGVAGIFVIIRQNNIQCLRHVELCEDALESEILAVQEGLNLALQQ